MPSIPPTDLAARAPTRRVFHHPPANAGLPPEGAAGIAALGHRGYVGGLWEEIGRLQFDFLRARGLTPETTLLDIACGALRLGRLAIPWLAPGRYLGLEKEVALLSAGLAEELAPGLAEAKRPEFVVSADFAFHRFSRPAGLAIAQSLFTHLPPGLIRLCLARAPAALAPGARLYATFLEAARPMDNPAQPHDHAAFVYTPEEMAEMGRAAGFEPRFLGDWGHPRGQVMMEYRLP